MVRFKAWNANNSRAIAKFHNAEIGHFGHNTFIHELIRGSLGYRHAVYREEDKSDQSCTVDDEQDRKPFQDLFPGKSVDWAGLRARLVPHAAPLLVIRRWRSVRGRAQKQT